jgi:hypothetical protein
MADLIIKPSVGTDNKLIIQNQAGNAVLTTDNSGATLSNVTVTSGNLSNTAIVYRSGASLQTKGDSWVPTAYMAISTGGYRVIGTNLEVSITCASTSNYLRVSAYLASWYNASAVTRGINVGFVYSTNNWTSEAILGEQKFLSQAYYEDVSDVIQGLFYDAWIQVPTTSTMKIQIATQSIGGNTFLSQNASSADFDVSSLIIQEIQS